MCTPSGLVVFDLETTGLSVSNDRIVSVAASCGDARFYSVVNPGVPIPAGASRVHGLYEADVKDARCWGDVAVDLFHFIAEHGGSEPALVAYNGARYDFPLLVFETKRAGVGKAIAERLDALYGCDPYKLVADKLPKNMPSKRLGNVYKHLFGVDMKDAHTADGDVAALARICTHESVQPHLMAYTTRFSLDKFVD
jgi:DNA polymerase-3 subunit epsilon